MLLLNDSTSKKTNRTSNAVKRPNQHRHSLIEFLEPRQLLAGQIFVTNSSTSVDANVAVFSDAGATVNANLIDLGPNDTYPFGIAVSGSNVFVANFYAGTVGEYTTAGATVNASLISGFPNGTGPFGITIDGSDLYVSQGNAGSPELNGSVGEYTLGDTPGTIASSNPTLITGVADAGSVVVSGTDVFLTDYALGTIDEFTTSGATVANPLVSGLNTPEDVAISGSDLYVTENQGNTVGKFTTSGATVNASLISISGPYGLGASDTDLFIGTAGKIEEYSTSGALVNANFITNVTAPSGILYVGDSSIAGGGGGTAGLSFAGEPATVAVGSVFPTPVTVDLADSSGNPITKATPIKVAIASGPAGGHLTGTTTAKTVDGVATFSNLKFSQPGTYFLKAVDGKINATSSTSILATQVGATQLVLASQPTTVAAGKTTVPITFDAESDAGDIITTNKSKVTLSIATGPDGAKVGGRLTVPVIKGVATFNNLLLTVAGDYTFLATDPGLNSALTGNITVTAGAVAKILVTSQPLTATVGSLIPSPVVADLVDKYGNLETTDDSAVGIASTPPGRLAGTLTSVDDGGVTTFSDLTLTVPGKYPLKLTDGKAHAVTQKIDAELPPATQLVFAATPTTSAAVKKLSPIKVLVEAADGTLITTDKSTVTISIDTGPTIVGGVGIAGKLTAKVIKGVATFSNLKLSTAGVYTLLAFDEPLTSAVSQPITVS